MNSSLHTWFRSFVQDCARRWRHRLDERVENPTRKAALRRRPETAEIGERDVITRAEDSGYFCARPPGSRTPSDVWGLGELDDQTIHILLVQVKSTAHSSSPRVLDDEDEEEVGELVTFVRDRLDDLNKAGTLPTYIRRRDIVVSAGYAGLLVDYEDRKSAVSQLHSTKLMWTLPGRLSATQLTSLRSIHRFDRASANLWWRRRRAA